MTEAYEADSVDRDVISDGTPDTDRWVGCKNELNKKVLYHRSEVLDELLLPSSSDALSLEDSVVDHVVAAVTTECASVLKKLKALIKEANDAYGDKSACEDAMYPHLAHIFRTVETTCSNAKYKRAHFRQLIHLSSSFLVPDDPLLPGSFSTKSHLVVAEVHPPFSEALTDVFDTTTQTLKWRQCPAFFMVKASNEDSPIPAQYEVTVKTALIEGADYARTILSSRPFQLHVFGVFVTGALFCVARFDRRGIQLSPEFNIFSDNGIRELVTVVLRLIWDMSPVDLGHDPTVSLLPGYTYYGEEYPRFKVKMSTHPMSEGWRTVGPPLWSSHSLLGRGTSVWRSVNASANEPQILKNAWHSVTRPTESEIYQQIKMAFNDSVPRGMATTPAGGGEVHIGPGQRVTIFAMRRLLELAPPTVTDAALHRVALNDFGKPIWRFVDAEQFVGAILSILKASRALREVGILHHDMSAGNVFIKVNATWQPAVYKPRVPGKRLEVEEPEGIMEGELNDVEGFLTNFESASFTDPPTAVVARAIPTRIADGLPPRTNPDKELEDGMTGTAVFTATALLIAMKKKKDITRTFEQDIESLAYVVLYSLYKHALEDPRMKGTAATALGQEFKEVFGAATVDDLLKHRSSMFGQEDISRFEHLRQHYRKFDRPLTLCVLVTVRFLSHLNQVKPSQSPDDKYSQMMETFLASTQRPPQPFEEVYKGWIEGLRRTAFLAAGGQGDKDEWLKSQSAHYFH